MKSIIVALAMAGTLAATPTPSVTPAPAPSLKDAAHAVDAGNYAEAVEITDALLSKDPHIPLALALRGISEDRLGKSAEAIADLKSAIALEPAFEPLHMTLCSALYHAHHLDEAISECSAAIALNPKDEGAYDDRALARDAKNDAADESLAVGDTTKAIEIAPKSWWPWAERCELKIELHREGQGAGQDCDRALALDPNNGWTLYQRGTLYFDSGDFANAATTLQHAVSEQTAPSYAKVLLGESQEKIGKYDDALNTLNAYIAKHPDECDAYVARAEVEEHQHQNDAAIADARHALTLTSTAPDNYNAAGRARALLTRLGAQPN